MKNYSKNKHSVLLFDIETMSNLGYVWEKWETNVISFKEHWYILTFAYKWLGEKTVHAYSLPDFKGYKKDKKNDRAICQKLWDLFDEASVLCAHNGDQFDIKKAFARFVKHSFPPPRPFKKIDTKKVAKKHFKFDSNKLDELAQFLGIGKKISAGGWDTWLGCAERDDSKSWKQMVKYNKYDVQLLEDVYLKLRPYIENHPNFNLINDTDSSCPNCGGELRRRGFAATRTMNYQRFQCVDCTAWSQKPLKGIVR